jgi:protein-tyrosine phosphatase
MLASDAATIETFLAHLDTMHGGIEKYLDAIGLTASEITALRDRLCA